MLRHVVLRQNKGVDMRSVKWLAVLAGLFSVDLSAGAPSLAEEAPALSVVLMARDILVAEDGRTNTTVHVEIHIGNESAVMTAGQQTLSFSADTEALEIVEAYTRKRDGKRIAVTRHRSTSSRLLVRNKF